MPTSAPKALARQWADTWSRATSTLCSSRRSSHRHQRTGRSSSTRGCGETGQRVARSGVCSTLVNAAKFERDSDECRCGQPRHRGYSIANCATTCSW